MNGEKNGKGKEYEKNENDEELTFEGEFLNGKRLNGKLYKHFGEIVYEIKDGKKVENNLGLDEKNENFHDIIQNY